MTDNKAKKKFVPLTIGDLKKVAENGKVAILDGDKKILIPQN